MRNKSHDILVRKNSVQRLGDILLSKNTFFTLFILITIASVLNQSAAFTVELPAYMSEDVILFANFLLIVLFSVILKKLIQKCSVGTYDRLYLVLLIFGASLFCFSEAGLNMIMERTVLLLMCCILFRLYIRKFDVFIPFFLFLVVFIRPIIVIPLIPYAFFYYQKNEFEHKHKIVYIATVLSALAAIPMNFVISKTIPELATSYKLCFDDIIAYMNDESKVRISIIVLLFFILKCSGLKLYSARLYRIASASSVISVLMYLLNPKEAKILILFFAVQGFIIWGFLRKNIYSYVCDSSKSRNTVYALFMCISVAVFIKQLIITFIFDGPAFGTREFRITPFYICYQDLGFVQRGVWGSIFRALLGDSIPERTFFSAYFVFYILLKTIFLLIIVWMAHHTKSEKEKLFALILTFAFVISPGFDKFFFELFNYIMAWLCVLLLYRNKLSVLLVPLFCGIAMLTHQIFASVIFPIVFIALVYRAIINSQGHTVRNTVALSTSLFVVAASFFYLTFFNAQRLNLTYEQMCGLINQVSGGFFTPHSNLINYVYLDKAHDHATLFSAQIDSAQIINAIVVLFLNLPALGVYVYSFVRSAKKEENAIKKAAYYISLLSILAIAPAFIIETDYGRWCSQGISVLILAPLILTMMQPTDKKWYDGIGKNKLYIMTALLILSVMIQPNYPQLLNYYSIQV